MRPERLWRSGKAENGENALWCLLGHPTLPQLQPVDTRSPPPRGLTPAFARAEGFAGIHEKR